MFYSWNSKKLRKNRITFEPKLNQYNYVIQKWFVKKILDLSFSFNLSFRTLFCLPTLQVEINVREYRRCNQKWTIQRNWQHRIHKNEWKKKKQTKKTNTIWDGHHYTQTNTNKVKKTWALLQTTGGKNEPNIVLMWKS